jgi:hypothetical protein
MIITDPTKMPHEQPNAFVPPPPKNNILGGATRFLVWSILALSIGFVSLITIALIFEDKINTIILQNIRKELNGTLESKQFSLSLITDFPEASAQFQNVELRDTNGLLLLKVEKLKLNTSIYNLLSQNIKLQSLQLRNGNLTISIDKYGKHNFDIFKKDANKSKSNTSIEVEKAILHKIHVNYVNFSGLQAFEADINHAELKGKFSADKFVMNTELSMSSKYFQNKKEKILQHKNLSINSILLVDLTQQIFTIHESTIKINDFPFSAKGRFQLLKEGIILDIQSRSNKASDLQNVIALLPPKYAANLKSLNCKGKISFKGTIQGKLDKKHIPKSLFAIAIENGEISEDSKNIRIKKINLHATLHNNMLNISRCMGTYKDNIFMLNMKLTNFKNPYIQLKTNGILPLGLFPNNEKEIALGGDLKLKQVNVSGNVAQIQHSNFENIRASGAIEVENGKLGLQGQQIDFDVHSNFNNQNIEIAPLHISNPDFNLKITGNISNYLGFLYKDQTLDIHLNTSFDKLDLDDFTKKIAKYKTTNNGTGKSTNINYQVNITIGKFTRKKLIVQDLVLKMASESKDNYYVKAIGKTMGGIATAEGKIRTNNDIRFTGKSSFEDVDFKELFRQFDNFDQNKITSANISGTADSRMLLDLVWNKEGTLFMPKQHIVGDLFVKNGMLNDLKILESFSKFIKVEDLRNVKFTNFENWFEIKDNKISLPETFLQSNALNLAISGHHKFDNTFNYGIEVNAGQVLMNKFRKHDPSLAPIPAKRHSFFSLYYHMNGSFDNYDFRMSKNLVTLQFEASQALKKSIILELNSAFGIKKKEDAEEVYKEVVAAISKKELIIPKDTLSKPTNITPLNSVQKEEDEDVFLPGFN